MKNVIVTAKQPLKRSQKIITVIEQTRALLINHVVPFKTWTWNVIHYPNYCLQACIYKVHEQSTNWKFLINYYFHNFCRVLFCYNPSPSFHTRNRAFRSNLLLHSSLPNAYSLAFTPPHFQHLKGLFQPQHLHLRSKRTHFLRLIRCLSIYLINPDRLH